MNVRRCNGCMRDLDAHTGTGVRVVTCIEGKRVDGLSGTFTFGGSALRNGEEFHWCAKCTAIAFNAVEDAAASLG